MIRKDNSRQFLFLFCFTILLILPSASAQGINLTPAGQLDWRIDHAVVVVDDLNKSIDEFRNAGYSVTSGGEFPGADTHNALIPFADGSYIELFAPMDLSLSYQMKQLIASGEFDKAMNDLNPLDKRFMLHLAEGPGLRDFALSAPGINLTDESTSATLSGLNFSSPVAMSRTGARGNVSYHVIVSEFENQMAFPFLITDDTPRSYRVQEVNASYHPNGATGIGSISVAAADPSSVLPFYDSLLSGVSKNQTQNETVYALNGSSLSILQNSDKSLKDGPASIMIKDSDGKMIIIP
ncbi:VOC family protein [Methanospirillum lacunae]|uniref:Glyoxalase-like domain-containing protein n=1 Tax=Methanospirillum lacunae TaxID=668570 RepID=A0A2V2MUQ0_9EURY|nr:VOC family protein [Methanospirillum lacunae]PWR71662.1 hypothetical protein DK846_12510 [Methanospirillum lacunae]